MFRHFPTNLNVQGVAGEAAVRSFTCPSLKGLGFEWDKGEELKTSSVKDVLFQ